MEHQYLSEHHRKRSEACQKEVEKMSQHPLSRKQAIAQIEQIKKKSEENSRKDSSSNGTK